MVGGISSQDRDSEELAEDRTDLAEDRTIMAVERTMASWMGAGMGLIGVALGLRAIFGEFEPAWVPKALSTFFFVLAIITIHSARVRMTGAIKRMSSNWVEAPNLHGIQIAAYGISLGAIILIAGVWLFFG